MFDIAVYLRAVDDHDLPFGERQLIDEYCLSGVQDGEIICFLDEMYSLEDLASFDSDFKNFLYELYVDEEYFESITLKDFYNGRKHLFCEVG